MVNAFYKYMQIKFVIITAAMFSLSLAWGSTAHFVIAAIAQIKLKECHLDIYHKAVTILNYMKAFTNSENYPFIEAAMFADDVKDAGLESLSSRHFQPDLFEYRNGKPALSKENGDKNGYILKALKQSAKTLKGVADPTIDNRLALSFELRMLMHYAGDIHQPLHSISRITQANPFGDNGGNKFAITGQKSTTLHQFWDRNFDYKDWKEIFVPILLKNDYNFIMETAQNLIDWGMQSNFKDKLNTLSTFKDWLDESKDIATHNVYDSIQQGQKPENFYITTNRAMIEKQLVLAGFRLAQILIKTLAPLKLPEIKSTKKPGISWETQTDSTPDNLSLSSQTALVFDPKFGKIEKEVDFKDRTSSESKDIKENIENNHGCELKSEMRQQILSFKFYSEDSKEKIPNIESNKKESLNPNDDSTSNQRLLKIKNGIRVGGKLIKEQTIKDTLALI